MDGNGGAEEADREGGCRFRGPGGDGEDLARVRIDFPDAWVQVGRFHGTDRSRVLDHAEIRSHPVRALEEVIAFVGKHTVHGAPITSLRRKEAWILPPVATRTQLARLVGIGRLREIGTGPTAPGRRHVLAEEAPVSEGGVLRRRRETDGSEQGQREDGR